MDISQEILVGMIALSAFVLAVSGASLYTQMQISSGNACGCFIPISLFIPFLACVGLFIGMLIYNLLLPEVKSGKTDPESFLKLFEEDEKKIVGEILKEGRVLQSTLVKDTDLSKVKVHRILKKLNEKGVIKKKSHGKTNRIKLEDEFERIFQ